MRNGISISDFYFGLFSLFSNNEGWGKGFLTQNSPPP